MAVVCLRLSLVAILLACGCGRINFDPLGGGGAGDGGPSDGKLGDGGGGGIDGTGPGVACVGTATPSCPATAASLNLVGTHMSSGASDNRGDGLAGSCGGAGSHEQTVQFLITQTGTFVFTTRGSNYDTVLYIRDGSCTGPELACNDNFGASFTSEVSLALTAGQSVIAIVDGANGVCGDFELRAGTNP
jgi:hypothetical protein